MSTRPNVDMIPMMDETLRIRSGKKHGGVRTKNAKSLYWKGVNCGNSALSESAKSTTSDTPLPASSKVKRIEVRTRALGPNAAYAISAYVTRVGSVSMHLESSLAE